MKKQSVVKNGQRFVTNNRIRTVVKGALGVMAILAVASVRADLLYTNVTFNSVRTDANNVTLGMRFTVGSEPIDVTALGIWDKAQASLNAAHQVALWDSNHVLIAQATVGSGVGNTLVPDGANGFRFATGLFDGNNNPISGLILAAGGQYTLGELQAGNDAFVDLAAGGTGVSFASDVTFNTALSGGPGLVFPTNTSNLSNPYLGPSLEFIVIPEPSMAMLCGIGAGLLWLRRRQR